MRGWIHIAAACGLMAQPVLAQHGIELGLSRTECEPGDVVELHARMKRPAFSEVEFSFPKSDSLRVIARQEGPVNYADGFYTQESRWVLQPVTSGVIELKGIRARFLHGGEGGEIELPARTLTVRSFGEAEDSFDPERLPVVKKAEKGFPYLTVVLAAVVLMVLLVVFFGRKRSAVVVPVVKPTLGDLRAALEAGELPVSQIEELLSDRAAGLSCGLRGVLECAVYGRGADRDELLEALGKEGVA